MTVGTETVESVLRSEVYDSKLLELYNSYAEYDYYPQLEPMDYFDDRLAGARPSTLLRLAAEFDLTDGYFVYSEYDEELASFGNAKEAIESMGLWGDLAWYVVEEGNPTRIDAVDRVLGSEG